MVYIANHKLTNNEFLEKLNNKNPDFLLKFDILENYVGIERKIKCECKKCHKIIKITPNNMCKKKQCGFCDGVKNQYGGTFSHEEFMKKFHEIDTHEIKVLGKYKNMRTKLDCECKLGHKFQRTPEKLLLNRDCPYCTKFSAKPLKGFNTFGDKFPWMIKYFKNEEDAFKYTWNSGRKVLLKCPVCGSKDERVISTLTHAGYFNCKVCGDKESLPNKFIRAIIEFKKEILDYYEFEYAPDWVNKKYRYDAYFIYKGKKYIVEMQGLQHKTNKFNNRFKPDRIEEENDKNKKELALKNDIDYYIEVEAYESSVNYLNRQFNNTILKDIFNLTQEDLIQIHIKIQKSQFKEIIDLYNSGIGTIEIGRRLNISDNTVVRNIKKGMDLRLVEYRNLNKNKRVYVVDKNNGEEYLFNSIRELQEFLKENNENITLNNLSNLLKQGTDVEYKNYLLNKLD